MQAGTVPLNESDDTYRTGDALMGRLFYSLHDRYMVTASVRRDGFSAFGQKNPRAVFPALALAWTFTSEEFAQPITSWFDYGKLRFSWGENGNRDIGQYEALSDMVSGPHPYIDQNGNIYITSQIYVNRMSNANLKWERTASTNVGLDFSFLNNRISGALEGYVATTNDLLVDRALPEIIGYNSVAANLGKLQNRGFEATVNANIIESPKFAWNASANFSLNRRKIVSLYGDMIDVKDEDGNVIGQKRLTISRTDGLSYWGAARRLTISRTDGLSDRIPIVSGAMSILGYGRKRRPKKQPSMDCSQEILNIRTRMVMV
jgi:hypothetical protein